MHSAVLMCGRRILTSQLFSFVHIAVVIITVAVLGLFSSILSTGRRTSQSSSEFEDKAVAFPFLSYADTAIFKTSFCPLISKYNVYYTCIVLTRLSHSTIYYLSRHLKNMQIANQMQ